MGGALFETGNLILHAHVHLFDATPLLTTTSSRTEQQIKMTKWPLLLS
jgi:hypothetical protein